MSLDEAQFWKIIERAKAEAEDDDEQIELIQDALARLEPEDIVEFQRIFDRFHRVSYRTDLWGAAFLMNSGASDDGFDYFRGWLIAQGKKVFEAALQNPDSLADVVPEDAVADFMFELEGMLYVGSDPWMEKTGLEMEAFYEALKPFDPLPALGEFEWNGEDGDIDSEKATRIYPKLWKKFGY
jgi:hypothetical protein